MTDAYGNVQTTNTFEITVTDSLRILENPNIPQKVEMNVGESLDLHISAKGEDLKYQWYFKKRYDTDWTLWKGHTDKYCVATSNKSWDYMNVRCRVTDGKGDSVTSTPSQIILRDVLAIYGSFKDKYTCTNADVNFYAWETGIKGRVASYQWYYKKHGASDWSVWNGRTSASFTAKSNNTWNGMQVRLKITDAKGNSLTSNAFTIYLTDIFAILRQPESITVRDGALASFSVTASGKSLQYQWYFKKKGAASWSIWNGHTTAQTSARANGTWNGMQVRCKLTNSDGRTLTTAPAVITVDDVIRITSQPANVTVVPGRSASFAVKATGSSLQYQWYFKKKGAASWSIWNGHTTAQTSAVANDSWDGMKVCCKITNASGKTLYSDEAAVTIARDTVKITQQPKSISIPAGHKAAFSVKATGNGLKYQWYYKKKGATDWSVWKIYTTASIEPPSNSTWNGMQVRCKITDAYGCTATSSAASVTLIPAEESDFFRLLQHACEDGRIPWRALNAFDAEKEFGTGLMDL